MAKISDLESIYAMAKALSMSFDVDKVSFQEAFTSAIDELGYGRTILLVAEFRNAVIGYAFGHLNATFYANGAAAWLEECFVDEQYRRNGVGHDLLEAFEERAKSSGARLIALATRRAGNFYLACGFEESATYFRKLLPMSIDDAHPHKE